MMTLGFTMTVSAEAGLETRPIKSGKASRVLIPIHLSFMIQTPEQTVYNEMSKLTGRRNTLTNLS
jgi:hypothetical protein